MRKVYNFEEYINEQYYQDIPKILSLFEGAEGQVDQELEDLQGEVGDISDLSDDEKASLLLKAVELEGDLDQIEKDDLETNIEEDTLNEAEGVLEIVEVMNEIIGNSGLFHFITEKSQKILGKKISEEEIKEKLQKIFDKIKNIVGLPAKGIEKFFSFVAKKMGASEARREKTGLIGLGVVTITLFIIGILTWPHGILFMIISLTSLLGKSIKLIKIGKKIYHLITHPKELIGEEGGEEVAEEVGNVSDALGAIE